MNKDIKRRDEIIFGDYNPDRYEYGGIAEFETSPDIVKKLLEENYITLDECQNNSPTTNEFLQEIKDIEEFVTFEGYTVDDKRDDYRVTIDEIRVRMPVNMRKEFLRLCTKYGYADEFHVWEDESENLCLRAWWD